MARLVDRAPGWLDDASSPVTVDMATTWLTTACLAR
jgi:hypothetical protein